MSWGVTIYIYITYEVGLPSSLVRADPRQEVRRCHLKRTTRCLATFRGIRASLRIWYGQIEHTRPKQVLDPGSLAQFNGKLQQEGIVAHER